MARASFRPGLRPRANEESLAQEMSERRLFGAIFSIFVWYIARGGGFERALEDIVNAGHEKYVILLIVMRGRVDEGFGERRGERAFQMNLQSCGRGGWVMAGWGGG